MFLPYKPVLLPVDKNTGLISRPPRRMPLKIICDSSFAVGSWKPSRRAANWADLCAPYLQDLDYDSVEFIVTPGEDAAGFCEKILQVTNKSPESFEGTIIIVSMCNDLFTKDWRLIPIVTDKVRADAAKLGALMNQVKSGFFIWCR